MAAAAAAAALWQAQAEEQAFSEEQAQAEHVQMLPPSAATYQSVESVDSSYTFQGD